MLTINHTALAHLLGTNPTHTAMARRIGVNASTVSRVLVGKAAPGPKFIAGVLAAFGTQGFAQVFTVTGI